MLAGTFAEASSDNNLDPKFRTHKLKTEIENPINRDDDEQHNRSKFNIPFNKNELYKVLKTKKTTAPGDDRITYEMFKHMPESMIDIMLQLINKVWVTGQLPHSWKHANVIPILKPNKK
ncbi:Hypothetical predicted protein [Mytilus galloprovincialis]|uniref:Reverse transcriptase domain-containing protein n=1 Tax=Mytilus galloprovincialis TaxID=29158 RepID=A0A8B6HUC0_MYTGA|nr:Hypothetical predicted protein [Mytilus galloprovincialis]